MTFALSFLPKQSLWLSPQHSDVSPSHLGAAQALKQIQTTILNQGLF